MADLHTANCNRELFIFQNSSVIKEEEEKEEEEEKTELISQLT